MHAHRPHAATADFDLGPIVVRPRERVIARATESISVEPLVMSVLVLLSRRAGQVVTRRELFDYCWGTACVGDDSLNRIVAALRKALDRVARKGVLIETVPAAGYILRVDRGPDEEGAIAHEQSSKAAVDGAYRSWRLGLPEPDYLQIELLRNAGLRDAANPQIWGHLALLYRHAAEYGAPTDAAGFVSNCEAAANKALALEPTQPEALTALASIVPLFGQWDKSRRRLLAVLADCPDHIVASQDLATLEMATGRIRAGKSLRDRLVEQDPLGATFCYKSVYQHWAVGDLFNMDRIADHSVQLWPAHPAVWMVRFWTLAYTERTAAALAMLSDSALRPDVPAQALQFFRTLLTAVSGGSAAEREEAVKASVKLAGTGPANAIASMFALGLMNRTDELFAVANSYYLRDGAAPVPVSHTAVELSLNEQHRRLTQILFMPVFVNMRHDRRFELICDRIGLSRYWDETGLAPDYRA